MKVGQGVFDLHVVLRALSIVLVPDALVFNALVFDLMVFDVVLFKVLLNDLFGKGVFCFIDAVCLRVRFGIGFIGGAGGFLLEL